MEDHEKDQPPAAIDETKYCRLMKKVAVSFT
jgi:hypothetical protein